MTLETGNLRRCWRLSGCSLETKMGTGDDVGDVAAVEWKRESTLSAWGVERRMVS